MSLFQSYGVSGVLDLMIGLLVLQIFVVLVLGVEPRNKRLEELTPPSGGPELAASLPAAAWIAGRGRGSHHP